jgi:hypothetical protein
MKNTPFTNNPAEKVEKMTEAANHIYEAINALSEAQKCAEHWAEYETLQYFKKQLTEFMSSDHGEAGFEPYLEKTGDDVFTPKDNPIRAARMMAQAYNRQGKLVEMVIPQD